MQREKSVTDTGISRRSFLSTAALAGIGLAFVGDGVSVHAETVSSQPTATPLGPAVPPEVANNPDDWTVWNGNYAGTRAASNSSITADNVTTLTDAWEIPLTNSAGYGSITSPVLVVGDRIYYQDTSSNTFAVERATGKQIWESKYDQPNVGPNGIAIGYGLVFGGIHSTNESYALDAETGAEVWRTVLSQNPREGITGPPTVYNNVVYTSTTPSYSGGDRGIIFAQDASNGEVLWTWDTTSDNLWGEAAYNSGGGVWYPITVDDDGNLYFGTGNPAPFPGNNGESRPGANLYTNCMVSLDSTDGGLRWFYQDKPHDLNDHDFQNSPIIADVLLDGEPAKVAIGSGKTGNVAAVLADSGNLIWKVPVGPHSIYGDGAPLPATPVTVSPGTAGGVQVPIAYANNTVFVPVNDQPSTMQSDGDAFSGNSSYSDATGLVVALDATNGSQKWSVSLDSEPDGSVTVANDVLFVGTLSGMLLALSTETGDILWSREFDAGFNAPPSIAGDTIYLPVGGPKILPASAVDSASPAAGVGASAPGGTGGAAIHALKIGS